MDLCMFDGSSLLKMIKPTIDERATCMLYTKIRPRARIGKYQFGGWHHSFKTFQGS